MFPLTSCVLCVCSSNRLRCCSCGLKDNCVLTHDISLDEFEDDDLSEITEITDERGMSLNCNGPDLKPWTAAPTPSLPKLHPRLPLLPLPSPRRPPPARHHGYVRPKRPTTLNLFPIVPRTQVSGLPLENTAASATKTKSSQLKPKIEAPLRTPPAGTTTHPTPPLAPKTNPQPRLHLPKLHPGSSLPSNKTSAEPPPRIEPTEEIYLTPVQRSSSDALDSAAAPPDRPFLSQQTEQGRMSISSDTEGPPPYQPLPDRTDQCIFEEDEIYVPPPSYASCVESLITPPNSSSLVLDLKASGLGAFRVGSSVEYVDATDDSYCGEDEDVDRIMMDGRRKSKEQQALSSALRTSMSPEASGLTYDSVKYTLVVDEHAQLELVSLKQCYQGYSDDSDSATVYDNCVSSPYESALGEEYEDEDEEVDGAQMGGVRREGTACLSDDSSTDGDLHFSKKFLNVFLNGRSSSSSAESLACSRV
ncbi:hypothetical protein WMY93_010510 [Mugilogobius chulae]|uniref:Uncharacterized protein n=1 Tax=Mugilogobius chulae TaxID=88201 RepID=A0AAW0PIZ6_9GOBI